MNATPKRLHHLDALRSFAMLLGIALHASLSFMPFPWPVQDSEQNNSYYLLFAAIHGFRMPLFFLLSGFFTAMLWRKRGVLFLAKHRVKRILVPLIVGCFTIIPATIWTIQYANRPQVTSSSSVKAPDIAPLNRDDLIGQTDPEKINLLIEVAIRLNDGKSLLLLIEQGADVNHIPETQITALHWATGLGQPEMAAILLDHGANINATDSHGSTAMHWAALFGRPRSAELLLERGADLQLKNDDGALALDMVIPEARPIILGIAKMIAGLLNVPLDEERYYADSEAVFELLPHSDYTPHFSFHHLWFLWYLLLLVILFCCTTVAEKYLRGLARLRPLVITPLRYLWMIPIVALYQLQMGPESLGPSTSDVILPNLTILGYYAVFFFFGAAYFLSDDQEERLGRYFWLTLPAAVGALLIALGHLEPGAGNPESMACWVAAYTCLMSFGLIGLCRKVFATENAWVRYVSDASYWMYVAHLPLVILAQDYVREWDTNPGLKFVFICASLTVILLASYQLLVRNTPIGWLLNGRSRRRVISTSNDFRQ